ncbi:MAG: NADAR family protein [Parachlamydiaceae bacterium]|nr:MAG: NADAR family protein [Parachlamydiaceae bacterium]
MKDIKNAETNPLLKQHMFDTYECAEAAFQHIKWIYISMERPGLPILSDLAMEQFRSADGEKAFQLSRALDQQFPNTYHSQWQNGLRDQVMWMILNIKFKNPALKTLLNSTGESFLIEHNNRPGKDKHWSDNHDGSGDNALGLMLMAIRAGQTQMPIVTDQHKQMNRQKLSQVNQFISQYSIFKIII